VKGSFYGAALDKSLGRKEREMKLSRNRISPILKAGSMPVWQALKLSRQSVQLW
jgi:hypothetical protein